MIQIVVKRDGRIVGFNEEKIATAIRKAMLHTEKGEDMHLIRQITDHIAFKVEAIDREFRPREEGPHGGADQQRPQNAVNQQKGVESPLAEDVGGAAASAKWVYVGNIKGQTGDVGPGAVWYTGTKITGTSTTATAFSGSGITAAKVGDMYLNTSTYNTYRCTVGGAASAAKWVYVSNIKGGKGDTGAPGADAITMTVTSSNGTIFKNTAVVTTLTAHVYKAGTELTAAQIAELGTIKWYKDGSSTAMSTTGATLNISSGDVTNKATYIAQLEG